MAEKTPKNPKGAGRNKYDDRDMVKVGFHVVVTKRAIKRMGGEKEARKKVTKFMEEGD